MCYILSSLDVQRMSCTFLFFVSMHLVWQAGERDYLWRIETFDLPKFGLILFDVFVVWRFRNFRKMLDIFSTRAQLFCHCIDVLTVSGRMAIPWIVSTGLYLLDRIHWIVSSGQAVRTEKFLYWQNSQKYDGQMKVTNRKLRIVCCNLQSILMPIGWSW